MRTRPRVFVGSTRDTGAAELSSAVRAGGGVVRREGQLDGVVWTDPRDVNGLRLVLETHPEIHWVQMSWAGIEDFADLVDERRIWTSGKGLYAREVAEHALMLSLAGLRGLSHYSRATAWTSPAGVSLHDARVVILGGGGIARALLSLLNPFGCDTTIVRRKPIAVTEANRTVNAARLDDVLPEADLVVLALPLTPDTRGLIDRRRLGSLRDSAWVVNVARGGHVVTNDLVDALKSGAIGGAALDVTDPEPLPPEHELWSLPNCIVTPHTASTPDMGLGPLTERVRDNVRRLRAGTGLEGVVDPGDRY